MKKFALPIVGLILLAVLGLLTWFLFSKSQARPDAQGSNSGAPAAPAQVVPEAPSAPAAELAGEPQVRAAAEPEQRTVAKTEAEQQQAERFRADKLFEITGRVQADAAVPGDEQALVLVLECGEEPSRAAREHDWEQLGERSFGASLLARSPMKPDGSFSLRVPRDAQSAWTIVRGRYLSSTQAARLPSASENRPLTLEARVGGWLVGRLQLPAGAAPEENRSGWRVRLHTVPGAGGLATFDPGRGGGLERQSAELDPSLGFSFEGVTPSVPLELRGVPEHWAAFKLTLDPIPAGKRREVVVPLARGARLSGRVLDQAGAPVAEAKLQVELGSVIFGRGGMEVREGKSGADGTFDLQAVAAGKLFLIAEKDGYLESRTSLEVADGQHVQGLTPKLDSGGVLAGVVRWPDGQPVARAEVDASFDPSALGGLEAFNAFQGVDGEAETDERGAFRITGLGKGPFVVRVEQRPASDETGSGSAGDGAKPPPKPKWKAELRGQKTPREDLELVLEPPLSVAGRVVDSEGKPVSKFKVSARPHVEGSPIAGLGRAAVSQSYESADGAFALEGLHAGKWELRAEAQDFAPPDGGPLVELPLPAGAQPVLLTLLRSASVSGRVVDPLGNPVKDAQVAPKIELADVTKFVSRGERLEARTQSDGSFTLASLGPGSYNLVASASGWARSEPVAVTVAESQLQEGLVLTLRRGGSIRVEVFDEQGLPASDQPVMAQNPADIGSQRMGSTGSDGQFLFEAVEPGDWQVMTFGGEGGGGPPKGDDADAMMADLLGNMKFQMAKVVEGQEILVQLGAPPSDPVLVKGKIELAGEGQAGVMVVFIADGRKSGEAMKFSTSDKAGRFELQLSEPGSYLVTTQKVGSAGTQQNFELRVDVPKQPEYGLQIDLPMGKISGTVRGPEGPAPGVRVSLWNDGPVANGSLSGGNYAEQVTDAGGRYEIGWLRPGTFVVAAGGSAMMGAIEMGGGSLGRQVRAGVVVAKGASVDGVDFRLEPAGSIAGEVRSAGQPAAGATVFARDETGAVVDRMSFVQTDAAGRFSYMGLAPGKYSVWARDAASVSPERSVIVKQAQASAADLDLGAGCLLVVTLTSEKNEALDCTVAVLDSAGKMVNGVFSLADIMSGLQSGTWSSKEQRVGPLPPGKYKVVATTVDGKVASKPVQLSAGQAERKVTLRLGES
jgi:uncharacterized GH25 family protein